MTGDFERRMVGGTNLGVPVLGFGAAHLGELYGTVREDDSAATLAAAWNGGIRLFDTAPWYGRGLSELRLGGLLRGKPRGDYVAISKVGRVLHRPKDMANFSRAPWTGGLDFEVEFDYTRDGFLRSFEQTLIRMGIGSVDALVIHDLDLGYQGDRLAANKRALTDSGIKALEELKRSGDIRAIGMGINTGEALEDTATLVDLDFVLVAMPYTLLDQKSLHAGMATCVKRGVSVVIGSPFASGILATGSGGTANYGYAKAPEAVQEKVRAIEAVCKAHGVRLPGAALHFVLAHPAVVAAVPGAAARAEVEANLAAFAEPIPAAFWSDLKAGGLIDPEAPVPGEPIAVSGGGDDR